MNTPSLKTVRNIKADSNGESLSCHAWDFSDCPKEELDACLLYEYSLESETIRRAAARVRENLEEWLDELLRQKDMTNRDRATCVVQVVSLADCCHFPSKHWLELEPHARAKLAQKLSGLRHSHSTPSAPVYLGPSGDPNAAWILIRREIDLLTKSLMEAFKSDASLREWPKQLRRFYLEPERTALWSNRLSKLSGDDLRLKAFDLTLECERSIERRHRPKQEFVVFEVDWNLREGELLKAFKRWTRANRVHKSRPRTGGRKATPLQLLKALGAKRVMASMPKSGPKKSFALAEDYTNDRLGEPLYNGKKSWEKAQKSAERYLGDVLVGGRQVLYSSSS